jgi:hypothetical protein
MKLVCFCVCIFFAFVLLKQSFFKGKTEIQNPKPHSVEDECSKRPRCYVSFKRDEKTYFHCQIVGKRRKITRVGENDAHEPSRACSRHL